MTTNVGLTTSSIPETSYTLHHSDNQGSLITHVILKGDNDTYLATMSYNMLVTIYLVHLTS